jgi:uncharacterized membrane protein YhaH (DUF805 family)
MDPSDSGPSSKTRRSPRWSAGMASVIAGSILAVVGIYSLWTTTVTNSYQSQTCPLPPIADDVARCTPALSAFPALIWPAAAICFALALVPLLAIYFQRTCWPSFGCSIALATFALGYTVFEIWFPPPSFSPSVAILTSVVLAGACLNAMGSLLLAQAASRALSSESKDWVFWAPRALLVGIDSCAAAIFLIAVFTGVITDQYPPPDWTYNLYWGGIISGAVLLGSIPSWWALFGAPKYGPFWHPNVARGRVT